MVLKVTGIEGSSFETGKVFIQKLAVAETVSTLGSERCKKVTVSVD